MSGTVAHTGGMNDSDIITRRAQARAEWLDARAAHRRAAERHGRIGSEATRQAAGDAYLSLTVAGFVYRAALKGDARTEDDQ